MSRRILIICPSWVGDVVMATPALRLLRESRPGAFIGALVRPGLDALLDGTGLFDEFHVDRATGVLGPKRVASRIRPRRYDEAVLLTNSFSTALIARIAGIPRRFGYSRDGRGALLTWAIRPARDERGGYAIVPAIDAYWRLISAYLQGDDGQGQAPGGTRLGLDITDRQRERADEILRDAGVAEPYAVLIPGASKPEKRWPPERFARIADHLAHVHGLTPLVSGSPPEREIVERVVARAEEMYQRAATVRERSERHPADIDEARSPQEHAERAASSRARLFSTPREDARSHARSADIGIPRPPISLNPYPTDLGVLKRIIQRASIVVCNDTGPRHIAAAFGIPTVALFGPTDHRWTTLRTVENQELVLADPSLPEGESANDHPRRCAIDRIEAERVIAACDRLLR